jgi:hypothetical protein
MTRSVQACCSNCAFFDGDPRSLEVRIKGLRTFGSGFASVRDEDGLCAKHQRYVSAHSSCREFATRTPQAEALACGGCGQS